MAGGKAAPAKGKAPAKAPPAPPAPPLPKVKAKAVTVVTTTAPKSVAKAKLAMKAAAPALSVPTPKTVAKAVSLPPPPPKTKASAAFMDFDPTNVPPSPRGTAAAPAAPAAKEPAPLMWGDGFVIGAVPTGRGSASVNPKAKSAPGSRRRTVERYSSSYHNLSYISEPRVQFEMQLITTNEVLSLVLLHMNPGLSPPGMVEPPGRCSMYYGHAAAMLSGAAVLLTLLGHGP